MFERDGEPYVVLEYQHVKKQRGKPIVQLKIKNLISGKVSDYTAHQNESFEEAEIKRMSAQFIYHHRGEYWFKNPDDPSNRFSLEEKTIGGTKLYLTPNLEVQLLQFKGTTIGIELPIKVYLKIIEAPPSIRGNTADSGTKSVTTETGLKVTTPLFIEQGDVIRVNTEKGEYVERVEKK